MPLNSIHSLARTGNALGIRQAIQAGADINQKNEFGSTALHAAIAEKQVEVVRMLLDSGADPRIQDANGSTALHYAVEHKLPIILESLVEQCPEAVSICDKHGNQPLWTATFNARGNYEMVSTLLRCGADPHHRNKAKLCPLDIPERKGDAALLRLLQSVPNAEA